MEIRFAAAFLLLMAGTARAEERRELGFGGGVAVGADLSFHVGVWKEAFAIGQWKPSALPLVVRLEPGFAHMSGTTENETAQGLTNVRYEEHHVDTMLFARGLIGADLNPVTVFAGGVIGRGHGTTSSFLCEGSRSGLATGFLFEANVRMFSGLEIGARADFWLPHGVYSTACNQTTHEPTALGRGAALLSGRIAYLFD